MSARTRTRTPRPRLALVGSSLLLASCSGLLHSNAPPAQSYVLHAPAAEAAQSAADRSTAGSLEVLRPAAAPGLETDRIAVLEETRLLTSYAASRWAAPLPQLLEALAVDTLRAQGTWQLVEGSRGSFAAQYSLLLTIQHFEARYAERRGPPEVHVLLDVLLQRRATREVLASFSVESSVRAAENRLSAVVAAFERAADAALVQAGTRAAAALRTSTAPSPPSDDNASK